MSHSKFKLETTPYCATHVQIYYFYTKPFYMEYMLVRGYIEYMFVRGYIEYMFVRGYIKNVRRG